MCVSFSDVDECLFDNGNCSDNCVNDIPFYHCECNHGDELDSTGLNCIHNVECFGKGVNCSCLPGYQDPSGKALNCTGNTDVDGLTQRYNISLCFIQILMNVKKVPLSVLKIHTVLICLEVMCVSVTMDIEMALIAVRQ